MTKDEAVHAFVESNFNGLPIDWVQAVVKEKGEEIFALPMWGTMWIIDSYLGKILFDHSRRMVGEASEINLNDIEDDTEREQVKEAMEALEKEEISWGETALLDDYVNEEMAGARKIKGTNAYIYEIDGHHVIGINGAGWNFYKGIWDRLYDICGMKWHDKEDEKPDEQLPESPTIDGSIAK